MKLSGQEIDAIVSTICNQENDKIRKEVELFNSQKSITDEAEKYLATFKKLPLSIQRRMYGQITLEDMRQYVIQDKNFKPRTVRPDRNSLKNKIILACIDSDSMESLKNKLGIDF